MRMADATRLTVAGRIATGAVSHIGGSEGFSIGCRSRHNFLQNIGRRFLPYKVMDLFPGRVLGKCREQPEPVARSLTHRLCFNFDNIRMIEPYYCKRLQQENRSARPLRRRKTLAFVISSCKHGLNVVPTPFIVDDPVLPSRGDRFRVDALYAKREECISCVSPVSSICNHVMHSRRRRYYAESSI
ncbi:hypothetical protein EVAR_97515_1 [Eumeta japonica]|uniref:Uncharacterized protein n=1 Tax=Eumeta variegata TaxID=151549 RepID=A0A4C1WPJ4_EUMVA|nr:hypothetical protein EVAR_97515_1 [Eumeta japonica]